MNFLTPLHQPLPQVHTMDHLETLDNDDDDHDDDSNEVTMNHGSSTIDSGTIRRGEGGGRRRGRRMDHLATAEAGRDLEVVVPRSRSYSSLGGVMGSYTADMTMMMMGGGGGGVEGRGRLGYDSNIYQGGAIGGVSSSSSSSLPPPLLPHRLDARRN